MITPLKINLLFLRTGLMCGRQRDFRVARPFKKSRPIRAPSAPLTGYGAFLTQRSILILFNISYFYIFLFSDFVYYQGAGWVLGGV
jgi:hypothetical protein